MLGEVIGTYSKDQGGISTNACRLYLQSRGLTPGCSVGGGAQALLVCVCAYVLIHLTPLTQGLGQHAGRTERAPAGASAGSSSTKTCPAFSQNNEEKWQAE